MYLKRLFPLIVLLSCGFMPAAYAEVAVVVNPNNLSSFDEKSIRKIFLGKVRSFSNGNKAEAFDLPVGSKTRDEFREKLIRKSEARLNSYWARMLFSSKAPPPKVLRTDEEIKAIISVNEKGIAYIDSNSIDESVRVIYKFK